MVLGNAIRAGYADLFAVYPDAEKRSQADLEHVFSTSSGGGKQVISRTIATFRALVEEAEFPAEGETDLHVSAGPLHTAIAPQTHVSQAHAPQSRGVSDGPALHIDIQIHISPEASADQIEQIFASMAKHVYGRKTAE